MTDHSLWNLLPPDLLVLAVLAGVAFLWPEK